MDPKFAQSSVWGEGEGRLLTARMPGSLLARTGAFFSPCSATTATSCGSRFRFWMIALPKVSAMRPVQFPARQLPIRGRQAGCPAHTVLGFSLGQTEVVFVLISFRYCGAVGRRSWCAWNKMKGASNTAVPIGQPGLS